MSTRGEFKPGDYVVWENPTGVSHSGTIQRVQQSERPGEYFSIEQDNGETASAHISMLSHPVVSQEA